MEIKDRAGTYLQLAVTGIEWIVAGLLVALAALATWGIVVEFSTVGFAPQGLNGYTAIIDGMLLVFVIAELFKIALAYIRHEGVIPTVMEAALVAVARKVVVLDAHAPASELLMRAGSLGLLLLAIALAWLLLARANPALAVDPPREKKAPPL